MALSYTHVNYRKRKWTNPGEVQMIISTSPGFVVECFKVMDQLFV